MKKSSKKESPSSDSWSTPQKLFDELSAEYGPFELDVCASRHNYKCDQWYGEFDNALNCSWTAYEPPEYVPSLRAEGSIPRGPKTQKVWMNPPYSDPYPWVKKASEEAKKGCMVVALLKWDHSVAWHKNFIEDPNKNWKPYPGVTVVKLPKRVKFVPPPGLLDKHGKPIKAQAKWPSVVVIF